MWLVKYTKRFTSGNLQGLSFDSQVNFVTLDKAIQFQAWCLKHRANPVKAFSSSDYTTHGAYIVAVPQNNNDNNLDVGEATRYD